MKRLILLGSLFIASVSFAQTTGTTTTGVIDTDPATSTTVDTGTTTGTDTATTGTGAGGTTFGNVTSATATGTTTTPSTQTTQTTQTTATPQQVQAWQQVLQVFGLTTGKVQDDVLRVTIPRTDLTVRKNNVQLDPALGLTTLIAFQGTQQQAKMTAEFVLLETEVQQVTSRLLSQQNVLVTALHNHLVNTTPVVVYLHVEATGNAVEVANVIRTALGQTATPFGTQEAGAPATTPTQWGAIQNTLGKQGDQKGNVLVLDFPRNEVVVENGAVVSPLLGFQTELKFQSAGTNQVAASGEFALLPSELNPVAKVLNDNGISVEAVHNHFIFERPRLIYLHFWTLDDPQKVATALKAALDKASFQR